MSKHFRKSSSKLREPRINGAFSLHPASEFSATIDNSAIKPSPAGYQTNRKGDRMTYNSPRIKDIKKPSGIDMQLTLGPKINMSDVNEIMNKRGGGQRKTVADLFNTLNQRKSNFTSIVDTRTMAEKPDNLSLNQFRTSVADLVTEVSIPKKSSPWRVFSFDKRPKGTFDSSYQGLASMVSPIKSNTSSYSAPIELNLKSSKQDAEIFKRKGSFTNLTIKPNYYMKSLEYYFMLERNDYFSKLYKEHFQLAFNSIKFVRVLNRASSDKFAAESKLNLKKKVFYKGRSSS